MKSSSSPPPGKSGRGFLDIKSKSFVSEGLPSTIKGSVMDTNSMLSRLRQAVVRIDLEDLDEMVNIPIERRVKDLILREYFFRRNELEDLKEKGFD